MRRFRAALLALGLVLVAAAAGAGTLAERARGTLDHDLRLAGASRVTALDDYAERARAVTLVASHSDAFSDFYEAAGTRAQRIRGEVGEEGLMPAVHLALSDLGVLFPNDIGGRRLHRPQRRRERRRRPRPRRGPRRPGRTTAATCRSSTAPSSCPSRRSTSPRPTARPRPTSGSSPSPPRWPRSADVSPALVHFDVPVESIRLALYSEDPATGSGSSTCSTAGSSSTASTRRTSTRRWASPTTGRCAGCRPLRDGSTRSETGQRHVVELARATANVATSWAVVVSVKDADRPVGCADRSGPGRPARRRRRAARAVRRRLRPARPPDAPRRPPRRADPRCTTGWPSARSPTPSSSGSAASPSSSSTSTASSTSTTRSGTTPATTCSR